MNAEKLETYADKINKMLRIAESTNHPEEADAFIRSAQALMTKYAIDEAMLEAARAKSGDFRVSDEIVTEEFVTTGNMLVAFGNLCYHVIVNNNAKAVLLKNDPRVIGDKMYKNTYILITTGFKSDIDRIRFLFTSLQVQAATFEGQWWRENKHLYTSMKRQGFLDRRQFLFSYAERVGERLREGRLKGEQDAKKEHGTGMELVLRDRTALVKAEYERLHPNLRTTKQRQAGGSSYSHEAGREAGGRADLGSTKLGGSRRGELNK
jgi:hypothetical protein